MRPRGKHMAIRRQPHDAQALVSKNTYCGTYLRTCVYNKLGSCWYRTIYTLENVRKKENGCTFISAGENVCMIYLENVYLAEDVFYMLW